MVRGNGGIFLKASRAAKLWYALITPFCIEHKNRPTITDNKNHNFIFSYNKSLPESLDSFIVSTDDELISIETNN